MVPRFLHFSQPTAEAGFQEFGVGTFIAASHTQKDFVYCTRPQKSIYTAVNVILS